MEILPITFAEPRADKIGVQADDEAKDGWFAKLLQASDERSDFRDPAAEETHEPDRAVEDRAVEDWPRDERAVEDRRGNDRDAAAATAGDEDAEATDGLPAQPNVPANEASAAAPIESLPKQRTATPAQPTAKLPPTPTAPGARTNAGQDAQITATPPPEKITHAGPQPTATPAVAKTGVPVGANAEAPAATKTGAPATPTPVSGHNPSTTPQPGTTAPVPEATAPVAAPLPQARAKTPIESRPKGSSPEPLAKPSGTGEGPAASRKEPAAAKTTLARNKASAETEAPRNRQNIRHRLGALSGPLAANPEPSANRAPAQQPGPTAATPGLGQSAANGNLAPVGTRPAALPSAPPGGATEQVALRIHKAVAGGQERISIKLHPAELGRIEVKLAWSDDGLMRAMISADKGETLELLQRDSRALERTLQDAGVKTDQGSLSFDLRGQGGRGETSDDPGPQTAGNGGAEGDEAEQSNGTLPPAANRGLHRGLLDLSV